MLLLSVAVSAWEKKGEKLCGVSQNVFFATRPSHTWHMSETPETMEEELQELPERPLEAPEAKLIPIKEIEPLQNVRSVLGDVGGLAESIRVRGLLHPVVVRPAKDSSHGKKYELIVGYRRLAAFQELERTEVPAVIHEANEEEVLAEVISENLQRENPSPMDEARTMQRMIDTFDWSHAQVAQQLGVDRSQVTKRLGLLRLPDKVQQMVAEEKISASHAEVVARLDTPEQQEELAELAVRTEYSVNKLNKYASDIKAKQQTEEMAEVKAPDQDTPMDTPEKVDLVPAEIPHLQLGEMTPAKIRRAELFILLRSANDLELLQWLEEHCSASWDELWEWTGLLDKAEIEHMIQVVVSRWLVAAHRLPTLPIALQEDLGAEATEADLDIPEDLPTMGMNEEDWDEEWEDDEEPF